MRRDGPGGLDWSGALTGVPYGSDLPPYSLEDGSRSVASSSDCGCAANSVPVAPSRDDGRARVRAVQAMRGRVQAPDWPQPDGSAAAVSASRGALKSAPPTVAVRPTRNGRFPGSPSVLGPDAFALDARRARSTGTARLLGMRVGPLNQPEIRLQDVGVPPPSITSYPADFPYCGRWEESAHYGRWSRTAVPADVTVNTTNDDLVNEAWGVLHQYIDILDYCTDETGLGGFPWVGDVVTRVKEIVSGTATSYITIRDETHRALDAGVVASLGKRLPRTTQATTIGEGGSYTIYLVADDASEWWAVLGEMYGRASDMEIDSGLVYFDDAYARMAAVTNMAYLLLHEIVHVAIDEVAPGDYLDYVLSDLLRAVASATVPDPMTLASLVRDGSDLLTWDEKLSRVMEIVAFKLSNFWCYLVSDNETDAGAYSSEVQGILARDMAVTYPARAIPLPNYYSCPAVLNPDPSFSEVSLTPDGNTRTSETTLPEAFDGLGGTYSHSWCGNAVFSRTLHSTIDLDF